MFIDVPELIILVPPLLGLKGNLEMTLASRLSTQVSEQQFVISVLPLQLQSTLVDTPYSKNEVVLNGFSSMFSDVKRITEMKNMYSNCRCYSCTIQCTSWIPSQHPILQAANFRVPAASSSSSTPEQELS